MIQSSSFNFNSHGIGKKDRKDGKEAKDLKQIKEIDEMEGPHKERVWEREKDGQKERNQVKGKARDSVLQSNKEIQSINKIMHLENLYGFSLVYFQPQSIILVNKQTKQPFDFHQFPQSDSSSPLNLHPEIQHPYLLRPLLYKNGALYAKGCQNLRTILDQRRRDYQPRFFSEQELVNTFEPIIQCLQYLKSKGISFSNQSPQNCLTMEHIIFFQNGDIKLKDWLFSPVSPSPSSSDFSTLSSLIASIATLLPQSQVKKLSTIELISIILDHYSIGFCAAIASMKEGIMKNGIMSMFCSKGEIRDERVKGIVDKAMEMKKNREKERQKNKMMEEKLEKQRIEKQLEQQKLETPRRDQLKSQPPNQPQSSSALSIQNSPTKKFNISNITTPNKKLIRLEDTENKKIFNEQVKKRQIQKITKIIERSNAFVNQLMARKNKEKEKEKVMGKAIGNCSIGEENGKKLIIKESPKIGSPSKRLRSISKKK